MLRRILYVLAAGVLTLLTACEQEPGKVVEPGIVLTESARQVVSESLNAPAEGLFFRDFKFTSKNAWSVEVADGRGWVYVMPMSGEGGEEEVQLNIYIGRNEIDTERRATVTISDDNNESVFFDIVQAAGKPRQPATDTIPERHYPDSIVHVQGIRAQYEDFIGQWTVTGTEHLWFMDPGQTPATYSYAIQIEPKEQGRTYTIKNWETGATDEDRAHLFYGHDIKKSAYDYLAELGVNGDIEAWYDEVEGKMHIDRQTLYSTGNLTIEFLADYVDGTGAHTSMGSYNETPGDTLREYTICDFVLQEDGSVLIGSHEYPIAFMGYAQYLGHLWSTHFNNKFAFPFSMKK